MTPHPAPRPTLPVSLHSSLAFRAGLAANLLQALPELDKTLRTKPVPGESCGDFLARLAQSTIPEEALSFAAYGLISRLAVWWGLECLLALPKVVTDQDRSLLAFAARWVSGHNETTRNGALMRALQSPRGPGAWIALGAGWDAEETGQMTGQAVATGVLLGLSRVVQEDRRRCLAQCVVMAQSLADQSLAKPGLAPDHT